MSLLSTSFHAISFRCRVFFVENQTCVTKSVHLILSLSQGSVAENIHRRTSTCHTFCLLRSLLPSTVISLDAISSRRSFYFLRLMRFPILVDMHGNLQHTLKPFFHIHFDITRPSLSVDLVPLTFACSVL